MDSTETATDFKGEVQTFLTAQNMAPRRLGLEAIGDPNFVRELLKGRKVQPRTVARVREFMAGRPNDTN